MRLVLRPKWQRITKSSWQHKVTPFSPSLQARAGSGYRTSHICIAALSRKFSPQNSFALARTISQVPLAEGLHSPFQKAPFSAGHWELAAMPS